MKVKINNEDYQFESSLSVSQLIKHLQLDPKKIAIEKNLQIIPCSQYDTNFINNNDNIEIVSFIGGG